MAAPVKPVPRTIQWTPDDSWVQKIFKLNLSDTHKLFYVEEFLNKVKYFLDQKEYKKQQKYIVQRNALDRYLNLKKTWGESIAQKIQNKLQKYFDKLNSRIAAGKLPNHMPPIPNNAVKLNANNAAIPIPNNAANEKPKLAPTT